MFHRNASTGLVESGFRARYDGGERVAGNEPVILLRIVENTATGKCDEFPGFIGVNEIYQSTECIGMDDPALLTEHFLST